MDNGFPKKVRQNKDFMEHVAELTRLFGQADQKALHAAVDAGDFNGLCKALGVSEAKLGSILGRGAEHAKALMKDPAIAEAAVRLRGNPTTD